MKPRALERNDVELLDAAFVRSSLGGDALSQLSSLSIARETVSTQIDAASAGAPAQGCAVFFAEYQSGGVGRNGRPWASPASANLYFSVSRRFSRSLATMSGLSLVVGVAAAEALHAMGFGGVRLKWPNDLWVDARKLGGILVQLRNDPPGCSAIIGMGLNVRMPDDAARRIDQAWCDLSQLGAGDVSRNEVAARLLGALLPALQCFDDEGLAPFLPRWHALDALRGAAVRVTDGVQQFEGMSLGINADGALRLRGEDGHERSFHGGEVSLRPA
ncbi:MAG: biotin--[acetyl-CoA-carboxylase] ligase [Gammaproteobacteria bacterium RIFCSPHIGHO2_12_FULL_63_22]|nr:MAG: biotin--[acetyl-CoA-carboxylase] ligase [Gammaproteobacteria bacterium RIFCSPHIGHO2_12_FULL_63_22]